MNPMFQVWPTPTPIPTPDTTPVPLEIFDGLGPQIAEGIVQGYQQANQWGVLDIVFFGILAFLIIGGIWSIIAHLNRI